MAVGVFKGCDCPVFEQNINAFRVLKKYGQVQRASVGLVRFIGIGSGLKQGHHAVGMAAFCCNVQGAYIAVRGGIFN